MSNKAISSLWSPVKQDGHGGIGRSPVPREYYFKEFVRWRPATTPTTLLRWSVIPTTSVGSGWSDNQLRIAVRFLWFESMGDFDPSYWGEEEGTPRFSMSLKDPDAVQGRRAEGVGRQRLKTAVT
jgi:hypothetical protein